MQWDHAVATGAYGAPDCCSSATVTATIGGRGLRVSRWRWAEGKCATHSVQYTIRMNRPRQQKMSHDEGLCNTFFFVENN